MKKALAEPVVLGAVRLAPTTELAGLAELAEVTDEGERLELLAHIARTIAAEDAERAHIRALRAAPPETLPLRRREPERRSA